MILFNECAFPRKIDFHRNVSKEEDSSWKTLAEVQFPAKGPCQFNYMNHRRPF